MFYHKVSNVATTESKKYSTASFRWTLTFCMSASSSLPSTFKGNHSPDFYDNLFIDFLYSLTTWACIPKYDSLVWWANDEKMFDLIKKMRIKNVMS